MAPTPWRRPDAGRHGRPMVRPLNLELAARVVPDAPFLAARGGGAGLSRAALQTRRFRMPDRGVRVSAEIPATLAVRCLGLRLVLPELAAFGGPTAGRLFGSPIPDHVDRGGNLVHVHNLAGGVHIRRPDVRGRRVRLPEDHVIEWGGLRLTTPARTFVDLGGFLSLRDLVAVGDAALRDGLCEREQIAAVLRGSRRRRGVRTARAAAELLDPRAESPQESRLRVEVVVAGLPTPVPNEVIRDASGEFLARGDLVFRRWRVVAEYDGAHHRTPAQQAADAQRRTLLREHGWYVVEIVAADLREPWRAVVKIAAALRSRGATW